MILKKIYGIAKLEKNKKSTIKKQTSTYLRLLGKKIRSLSWKKIYPQMKNKDISQPVQ